LYIIFKDEQYISIIGYRTTFIDFLIDWLSQDIGYFIVHFLFFPLC